MKKVKVGINGFGRIGRNIVRAANAMGEEALEFVGTNDLTDAKTLAHLLKYDSVHGKFKGTVEAKEGAIAVNGKEIKIFSERDPGKLPWKDLGVDIVMECTGLFLSTEKAQPHINAGAKKVILSAPAKGDDVKTFVYGVNHNSYNPASDNIISNASCTTNCLAPFAKVINDKFGIVKGLMTTIHAYTNDQSILDLPHKDLRRARAAAMSMIPTTTGAAKAVGLVIPELKGKLNGFAVRVPTADVSMVDLVAELKKSVTKEEINAVLKAASEGELKGILAYTEEPLVSIDFTGTSVSSTIDALSTMVIEGNMVKIVSWYDNEMGFSYRMVDMAKFIGNKL